MPTKINGIKNITVQGFKSIQDKQSIEIRPLTILAGANSSGKSSIMQPLLLLKQTLEVQGDPGALLLDGPNVRFTSSDQILSKTTPSSRESIFSIYLESTDGSSLGLQYCEEKGQGFDLCGMNYTFEEEKLHLKPGMDDKEIFAVLPKRFREITKIFHKEGEKELLWQVRRDRCFLTLEPKKTSLVDFLPIMGLTITNSFVPLIQSVIHLPGLRGNPRRTYPKTASGPHFPGVFDVYTASIINNWQEKLKHNLVTLSQSLENLGLSWKVSAKSVDATQVELRVGRTSHSKQGGAHDMVSIADVGFGISQSLPVLVALIVARPGQMVYIEQPEIHLHPKAQRRLAHLLCEAAKRNVILVIETHSALLLREIQTLVASSQMPQDKVILHWFQRDERGATCVMPADLDENGAYGNWPEDFDATELEAEQAYLDAVEQRESNI